MIVFLTTIAIVVKGGEPHVRVYERIIENRIISP